MGLYNKVKELKIELRHKIIRAIPDSWVRESCCYVDDINEIRKQSKKEAYSDLERAFNQQIEVRFSLAKQAIEEKEKENENYRHKLVDLLIQRNGMREDYKKKVEMLTRSYEETISDLLVRNVNVPSYIRWSRGLRGYGLIGGIKEIFDDSLRRKAIEEKKIREEEQEKRVYLEEELLTLEKHLLEIATEAIIGVAELSRAPYAQVDAGGQFVDTTKHFWRVIGKKPGEFNNIEALVNSLFKEKQEDILMAFKSKDIYKANVVVNSEDRVYSLVSVNVIPYLDNGNNIAAYGLTITPKKKKTLGVIKDSKQRAYERAAKRINDSFLDLWGNIKKKIADLVPTKEVKSAP